MRASRRGALVLLPALVASATAEPKPDLAAYGENLIVLKDPRGRLVVYGWQPDDPDIWVSDLLVFGDARRLWQQRLIGGGGNQTTAKQPLQIDISFWNPGGGRLQLDFEKGTFSVSCGAGKAAKIRPLERLAAGAAKAALAKAVVEPPLWNRRVVGLARDVSTYYFVDLPAEPTDSTEFRLFVGKRGTMKQLAVREVIADEQGVVLTTARGTLTMKFDRNQDWSEGTWIAGKKTTTLGTLSTMKQQELIFGDLGVYVGQRLGTPCDP